MLGSQAVMHNGASMSPSAWVYIVTNKPNGVLYIGVTSDLRTRARQHCSGNGSAFTAKYNCARLVYYEAHPDIATARTRERQLKAWKRDWKVSLIESMNASWSDLGENLPSRLRSQPSLG